MAWCCCFSEPSPAHRQHALPERDVYYKEPEPIWGMPSWSEASERNTSFCHERKEINCCAMHWCGRNEPQYGTLCHVLVLCVGDQWLFCTVLRGEKMGTQTHHLVGSLSLSFGRPSCIVLDQMSCCKIPVSSASCRLCLATAGNLLGHHPPSNSDPATKELYSSICHWPQICFDYIFNIDGQNKIWWCFRWCSGC